LASVLAGAALGAQVDKKAIDQIVVSCHAANPFPRSAGRLGRPENVTKNVTNETQRDPKNTVTHFFLFLR